MKRDPAKFPDDENGEILWRLTESGDDLSIARDIDFSLDFSSEQAALDCGAYLFRNEYKIQLDPPLEDDPDSPWTVQVMPFMAPDHAEISALEAHLATIARHFGGDCTGWGCEQVVVGGRVN
jgi:hypothetical protein